MLVFFISKNVNTEGIDRDLRRFQIFQLICRSASKRRDPFLKIYCHVRQENDRHTAERRNRMFGLHKKENAEA